MPQATWIGVLSRIGTSGKTARVFARSRSSGSPVLSPLGRGVGVHTPNPLQSAMKTSRSAALKAVVLTTFATLFGSAFGQDPLVPAITHFTATPSFVQVGASPTLSWGIKYPALVKDIVTITPPGTVTPKKKCTVDVRVIGASVKVVWLNSWGVVTKWEWAPTEAQVSIANGTYSRIFYNTQDKVNPNTIVYNKTVNAGQAINFAGRYYYDGWSSLYKSTSSGGNVVALVNGDNPPTTTPLYQQPTIEDFIKPYLDGQGRIKIGPKDVIYLMELTHTNKNDGGFDLQDLALLATFKEVN
jgi:hypothetical protein